MEKLKIDIGKRLLEIREGLLFEGIKVSSAQFAKMFGETTDKIQNYERGVSNVPNHLLVRLYRRGINPTYILTGEGSKFADNEEGRKLKTFHVQAKSADANIIDIRKFDTSTLPTDDLVRFISVAAGDIGKRLEGKKGKK
ncbi:MAG: hypothetical protein HW421_1425 [Ignavibacteria bacterium]|nr:hypothetical protein [Ignavibacteria bacterium]